jgi:hypothetical protein
VRSTIRFALLPLVLLFSGCVLHVHRNVPPPPGFSYSAAHTADAVFERGPAYPVNLSVEPLERARNHDIYRLSFRSSGNNGHPENLVEGQYFRARDPGAKKLVVVMPIWGTSDYPPAKISSGYAARAGSDTHVIWIYGTAPLFPWTELSHVPTEDGFVAMAKDSAERYRTAVIDMRRLLDWMETREEIDPARIAFVGLRMIHACRQPSS